MCPDSPTLPQPALDRPPNGRLLLVTAVRLRDGPNGLQIDDQTFAGLRRCAEQFREVVFAGISLASGQEEETSANWVDVASLPCINQMAQMAGQRFDEARLYRERAALIAAYA